MPDVRSAELNVYSAEANGKFIGLLGLFLRMAETNASHWESNLIGLISGSCLDVLRGRVEKVGASSSDLIGKCATRLHAHSHCSCPRGQRGVEVRDGIGLVYHFLPI